MPSRYDAVIIGVGQAAPILASRFSQEGWRVAIVERDRVGGSCVNFGCTPTKALVASARIAALARRGAEHGIELGEPRIDFRRVQQRQREMAGASRQGLEKSFESLEKVELIRGQARLAGPRSVVVGDRTIETDRIFLNVGTRSALPDVPGLAEAEPLTSSSLLASDRLPERLMVLGGGPTGLELAQIFHRLGSEVTIVDNAERLLRREDEDVSETMQELLEGEGIEVVCGCDDLRLSGARGAIEVEASGARFPATDVLLAAGRRPNTDDLGLEAAGVSADRRGFVEVNDRLETGVEGIWAVGDCNGRGAFTHTSVHDAQVLAANLFDDANRSIAERIPCYAIYTDPPLARCGANKRQAKKDGRRILRGQRPMANVSRAKEKGETHGFMEVLVDAETERVIGGTIFGVDGDEAIHTVIAHMDSGAPYQKLRDAMHIHPTVSELIPTVLQSLEPLE